MLFITNSHWLFTQSYSLKPCGWLPALNHLLLSENFKGFLVPYIHCFELRGSELYTRGATGNEPGPSQTQALASTQYSGRGDPYNKQRALLPHFVLLMLQSFSLHFAIHQTLLLEIYHIFTL